MKTLMMLLLALPAAAGDAPRRGPVRETLCIKKCIAPHDSRVLACKALQGGNTDAERCLKEAEQKRRACEAECRRPLKTDEKKN